MTLQDDDHSENIILIIEFVYSGNLGIPRYFSFLKLATKQKKILKIFHTYYTKKIMQFYEILEMPDA